MAARPSIKKICRVARMSKAPGSHLIYLRDLCASAMAKADANGYVVGPAGGRVKKADVILAIRHATSLLSELPKGRSKRR